MISCNTFMKWILSRCSIHNFNPLRADGSVLRLTTQMNGIMPLNIIAYATDVVHVNHTYIANGEALLDPEIGIWRRTTARRIRWHVYSWEQHPGTYRIYINLPTLPTDTITYHPAGQRDASHFVTNTWLPNLKHQGFSKRTVKVTNTQINVT